MFIVRENRWVREYRTERGPFLDSRFRTGECKAGPSEFMEAWYSASDQLALDMEASFRFFPDSEGAEMVLADIAKKDPRRADTMRSRLFGKDSVLDPEEIEFLKELRAWLDAQYASGALKRVVSLENQWFVAYQDAAGVQFEPKIEKGEQIDVAKYGAARNSAADTRTREVYDLFWGFHHAQR